MIGTVQCELPLLFLSFLVVVVVYCCWLTLCLSIFSTFLKRKGGLFKKAHELAVLCSVDVAVIIFGHNKKLYEFSSCDMRETLGRYQYVCFSFVFCIYKSSWLTRLCFLVRPTS